MGILITFFGTVAVATTVLAVNLFFMGVANVLRLIPALMPLLGRGLWGVLVFSCRLYYLLLTRLAPAIEKYTKVKLLHGLWRLGTTLALSLALGLVVLFVSQIGITFWTVVPFVLHGLFVDFVWDDIPGLGELQMGVRT